MKMDFCVNTLGHGKYSKKAILAKEQQMMAAFSWDVSIVTQYEVY